MVKFFSFAVDRFCFGRVDVPAFLTGVLIIWRRQNEQLEACSHFAHGDSTADTCTIILSILPYHQYYRTAVVYCCLLLSAALPFECASRAIALLIVVYFTSNNSTGAAQQGYTYLQVRIVRMFTTLRKCKNRLHIGISTQTVLAFRIWWVVRW